MQRYTKLLVVLFFSLSFFSTWGQKSNIWKNFTDLKNINDAVATDKGLWCGTDGGAFYYSFEDSSFTVYNKPEGLNGSPVTAVTKDKYNKIWFGCSNGIIDVFDPSNKSFKRILDIYNSDRTMSQINSLMAKGDTIFVSTDFGLSLINPINYFLYDTFFKFGSLSSNIKVNSCLSDKVLYVSVAGGVAMQKAPNINLSYPESWQIFTTADGLLSGNVTKIINFRDTIIASTNVGLCYLDKNKWKPFTQKFENYYIFDMFATGDSLFTLDGYFVYLYRNGLFSIVGSMLDGISKKFIDLKGNNIFLTSGTGVKRKTKEFQSIGIKPNCPNSGYAYDMTVDSKQNLWVASRSNGFFKYDGETWTNFTKESYPGLKTNEFYNLFSASDERIYAGSYGNGFVRINKDNSISGFTSSNTPLLGLGTDFLAIEKIMADSKSNLWILNYNASNRKTLNVLTKDSVWYQFENPESPLATQYTDMIVDQYDTKWFISQSDGSKLYFFNENNSLSKTTDDVSGTIVASGNFSSADIKCLALDRRGDVWVGNSLGANIITNTFSVLNSGKANLKILSVYNLRQQTVNCIAVDPLNQKWIGTNQGLMLVSSDGSSIISYYDTKNSPLLSNIITSIAVNENTGVVYAGTEYGISAFPTDYIKPKDSFGGLEIYPNPLVIDGSNKGITVDGLIKETELKIISVSGQLIRQFTSPGGRVAFWDGKDSDGNFVASGIYIVVAYNQDGSSVASAKVAVIRKK